MSSAGSSPGPIALPITHSPYPLAVKRVSLLLLVVLPAVILFVRSAALPMRDALELAVRGSGLWAFHLLVAVLALGTWGRVRGSGLARELARHSGRASLVYALVHVALSVADWRAAFWSEAIARPYVALGASALIFAVGASGVRSRARLLAEAATGLALLHYLWATEASLLAPALTAPLVIGLIGFRSTIERRVESPVRRRSDGDQAQEPEATR